MSAAPAAKQLIYVGPDTNSSILEAVVDAGGQVTSHPEQATAFIWLGHEPDDLSRALVSGVRWVQLPSAGIDHWLSAGVLDRARVWTSASAAYADAVAEHALALILAGAKDLHLSMRRSTWEVTKPRLLHGSTVLLVGSGRIGQALIGLLAPFDARVIAVSRSGRKVEGAQLSASIADLEKFLPEATYVVVTAPATESTQGLIGARQMQIMPTESWLINVSRGVLVDTDALVSALETERVAGAALDTTNPEPLPSDHRLWSMPNVIITPHVANPRQLAMDQLANLVGRNVRSFLSGGPLNGVIDIDSGY